MSTPPFRRSPLSALLFKTSLTFYVQTKRSLQPWFCSRLSAQCVRGKHALSQQTLKVYRVTRMKETTHLERGLKGAVERSLVEIWPQVIEYTAQKKINGQIWAQIRWVFSGLHTVIIMAWCSSCSAGFHHSGPPSSNSDRAHATIRLYDGASKHIGGVHVAENATEAATFRGGIKKISYYGEQKVEANFLFTINIPCCPESPHCK